jgi:hypothetical protein
VSTDGVANLCGWYSAGGEVELDIDPRFRYQLDDHGAAVLSEAVGALGALVAGRRAAIPARRAAPLPDRPRQRGTRILTRAGSADGGAIR